MYFDKEIVLFHYDGDSRDCALKALSDEFLKQDLVAPEFYDGILSREKQFPTGLFVNGTGIAIPHTNSDLVKNPQIGFMSLKNPVKFRDMANMDNEIDVSLIFMLALKKSEEQLATLQKLMDLFQNETLINRLKECTSVSDFRSIMNEAGLD